MVRSTGAGAHDTHIVVLSTKGQDGALTVTGLADGFGSRFDRPLSIPTIVDVWPKPV